MLFIYRDDFDLVNRDYLFIFFEIMYNDLKMKKKRRNYYMNLKSIIKLAQLYSTTASVFPFLIGLLYSWYHYQQLQLISSIILFVTVVLFHAAVNIRDEYLDYKVASEKNAPHAKEMTVGRDQLDLASVKKVYNITGLISALLGIYLVSQTSIILLYIGLVCYLVGILYTSGTHPISSTPYGEIFSGIVMGFAIYYVTVFVNAFGLIEVNVLTTGKIFLASVPLINIVINIMLANNICDLKEDVEDNRFTLPYYIGKSKALFLFKSFYAVAYISLIVSVFIGVYPKMVLLTLLAIPLTTKNTNKFLAVQSKSQTFIYAVQNSAIIPLFMMVTFILGILLNF